MLRNIQRTQKNGQMRYTLLKGCMALLPLLSLVAAPAIAHDNMEKVADKSENGNLTLRITDAVTGEPIPGAMVKADDAKIYVTDASGNCVMTVKDQTKKIKITVTSVGYKNYTANISPRAGIIPIKLKEDAQMLGGVTVTSKKRHTDIMQQTKTLDQDMLEKGGATSLAKLLETVPGVSSISTGSTIAKPVIQGMHSSRILLMNNGVKLESQSWGADHAPELDYTGSSMVEVVKGAECIRYGFGAMGGVVLLNDAPLPYGHDKPVVQGSVNMGYDTNARGFSGSGTIESGYKNFGLRVHGNYTKGGDYRTADYILNNTGYNTISMSAMGGVKTGKVTATLFSSLYYQRSGIYYASKISDMDQLIKRFEYGRPDEQTFFPFSYEIKPPFQQSQHFTVKGDVKWDINKNHKIDVTGSYQVNLRQEFENRKKTQWSWIPMQDLMLSTYKLDALWNAKWNKWDMTSDVGLSNSYQENYNYPGTKQPAFVPNFAALSMGGFFLHKVKIHKLQCALGMRYDFRVMSVNGYTTTSNYTYYDDFKIYSNFTSSLATHYQFNDNWDARFNIGWSWRPPDINELYAIGLQDGSYWVVGNRHLESERGWKSVLGGRYRNTWLSVEPSAFFQKINSYIYDHIGEGKERFHNHPSGKYPKFMYDQDDVNLYGGDIEATVNPMKGLAIVAKGEWIFARNITRNDWLPFMPSDRYGLSGTYEKTFGSDKKYNASVNLSGIYVTKQTRFDPDKDLVPASPDAYFLLNGSADLTIRLPQKRQVKLMLVGENILNALYKEYTDRFRYYAHERGVNLSVRTLIKF